MYDWKDRKVLVLGLGDTGLSMTRWLAARGARVSVADTRATPPHANALADLPGIAFATGPYEAGPFEKADVIAISPGVDRREPLVADAIGRGVPVIGDIEIFAEALGAISLTRSVPRPQVIAITGSNGKSTVTAMTGEAARAAGWKTVVAGNIGLPVLDALTPIEAGEPMPDVFVLELSSFQLESTSSLHADAATVLNITEDHLDRYEGISGYAAAKARIFEGGGVQILNRDDSWSMSMALAGRRAVTFGLDAPGADDWGVIDKVMVHGAEPVMQIDELPVAGLHNAANALAALALGHALGLPIEGMAEGLRRFRGLPHRLEKVGEMDGIAFFDDSKGTNVGATVAALNGMTRPVVLIAGGDGKGQDFSPLAAAVAAHARAVVLIGRDAGQIERAIAGTGVHLLNAQSLEEAVALAYGASRDGDAVLLSPACASYDMFRSYVHRGEVFVQAVQALVASTAGARAR
ncbi:MAG TPA: UDP-N-acetylmuramoyl-L-alanine--D-glutamate ligase [Burkholderiales bacterium]|nr:UDP-N-acetylmuramoyl-L-alanine--D-glutamate ligase [Burkholderiales bacterium]